MIQYIFNTELDILEVTFIGEVSISEVFDYIKAVREDESLPKGLKIFSDATNAKFAEKVKKKDLIKFIEENRISLEKRDYMHDAFIVSSTIELALGMLYRTIIRFPNYKFNIFSTKNAAINWLQKI